MIDEYWTWVFYGYHSYELKSQSHKPIVAICDDCCQYRVLVMRGYHDLCKMCSKKAMRGKKKPPFTDEHRRNLSIAQKGRKGIPHTEEWKRERSAAMMGDKNPMYGKRGKGAPFYGRHHTEEAKRKMSSDRIGSHATEEAKHKMSISRTGEKNHMYGRTGKDSPLFGKKHSEEWKLNISKSLVGRIFSEEHRNNLSSGKTGKKIMPFTDDHKQKLSASHQGIPYDEWVDYTTKDWRDWSKAIFLNDPFPGCARHHITNTIVVCIPIELHEHIHHNMHTGRHMDMINALAIQFIIGEW